MTLRVRHKLFDQLCRILGVVASLVLARCWTALVVEEELWREVSQHDLEQYLSQVTKFGVGVPFDGVVDQGL